MTPKVSVLMSVLNGERFLAPALDSILSQTFADFELIVIDNCSSDDTASIISSYSDDRIVRLRNDRVLSLTESLNKGLAAARGEYVARLDADDIAAPERLAKQIAYFDTHPDTVLLGSHYRLIDERGLVISVERPPCGPDDLYEALAYTNLFAHSTAVFRRDKALSVGGYPVEFRFAQDYALWQLLAQIGLLGMVAEPLVDLRKHSQQTTLSPSYAYVRYREAITLFKRAQRLPALSRQAVYENRKMQANYRYQYARALIGGRRYSRAAIEFAIALATAPIYVTGKALTKMAALCRPAKASCNDR